ncbi:MAG: T9SS type A sorting domain-containing protein [Crocinitomicaceae bacterium]|nr:T9SS type A sorting domain-containing protein [Crocinitomicaceae bacterium]
MKLKLSRKTIFTLLLMVSSPLAYAQPGGVGNEALWLRSDDGVSTSSGTDLVDDLNDRSGNGVVTNIFGDPRLITDNALYFNYNPSLSFDGDGDYLEWNGLTDGWTEGEIFIVTRNEDPNTGGVTREIYDFGYSAAAQATFPDPSGLYFDDFGSGLINTFGDLSALINPSSQYIQNSSRGANTYSSYIQGGVPLVSTFSFFPSHFPVDSKFGIGNNPMNESYLGQLGDIILYEQELPFTNRQMITTYLAIKYGITIRYVAPGGFTGGPWADYVSPDGTVVWDSDSKPAYHNNILGLGREDIEGLNQRQSHTEDDSYRIYLGSIETSNLDNINTVYANSSYLMVGSNMDSVCATSTSNSEIPPATVSCNLTSRLAREWRVTNTNFTNTFNWDVRLPSCAIPGAVILGGFRLLIDDDGDFSNGGTQCYYTGDGTGISIDYNFPVISVSGISNAHIPASSTRYMTIATIYSAVPLPVELASFKCLLTPEKTAVDIKWETSSEKNSDYFGIMRSRNGIDWKEIVRIPGAGNSNNKLKYTWTDNRARPGENYYRLKQVDKDGEVTYSDICVSKVEMENKLAVYPNPANAELFIETVVNTENEIKIFSIMGREVVNIEMEQQDLNLFKVNLSEIERGTYFVQVGTKTKTFVKY